MHISFKSTAISLLTIFTLIVVSSNAIAKVKKLLNAKDEGRCEFPIQATSNGKKINGVGTLEFLSKATNKFPVIIIVHTTKGLGYRENTWADYFQDQGYATFVLDYFKPHGTKGKGRNVLRPPEDVWGALSILSTHPRLDMNKVAVIGYSNGGSVTRS